MRLASLLGAGAAAADSFYTHFHPQPLKNWQNDPNGPMYFKGYYHLFFQYNPTTWDCPFCNIHWYHMVSEDLLHWEHLPIALAPTTTDCGGVYSGSATVVKNQTTGEEVPILSYSVACGDAVAYAVPGNLSDPKLVEWVRPDYNPVIKVPKEVTGGFRDPTSAWQGADKVWRLLTACGDGEGTCQFKSPDLLNWTYAGAFHQPGTIYPEGQGIWECPDFYPVPGSDSFVLKASNETTRTDWWAVGKYTEVNDSSKADLFELQSADIQEGAQQVDFGTFYASKTFHDPVHDRQILIGWINYHCNGTDWAGIQSFPRVVSSDPANATRLMFEPIAEIAQLRNGTVPVEAVVEAGAKFMFPVRGDQLDVEVVVQGPSEVDVAVRVLAPEHPGEEDGLAVRLARSQDLGQLNGNPFAAPASDPLRVRLLVDHSIVEAFAQGGRAVASYPHCRASPKDTYLEVANLGGEEIRINALVHMLKTANVLPDTEESWELAEALI